MGIATESRLIILFCLIPIKSAAIRRALRKAVSPEVIGAAMTPRMARMPPNVPSQLCEMVLTMTAGDELPIACCNES